LAAAEALRVGAGLDGAAATGQPPLALVVAAVFPTTLALVPAVLSGATVLASFLLGRRLAGRRCGLVAAALVAALPLLWDQRLPGVLAGLATVVALLLVWPDRVTVARAGTAGGLLVLASLARPEAVLVVPVAAVWLAAWPGRTARRERRAALVAFVVVALTGVAVAVAGVPRADGDWVPGGAPDALGTGPLGPLAALIGLGLLALAIDELAHRAASGGVSWRRHLPWLALPALGGVVALLGRGDHGLGFVVAPLVAVGAAAALARRAGGSTAAGSGP
ncbi:MAG: hypothetical protein KDB10_14005, partial [Acidimicrobiales bacterium]|nr:hypothetical protein [Acidimicrobiales bacterium]